MALSQEEEVVLKANTNGFVVGQSPDDRECAVRRTVERGIRAPVNTGHLDQDADLRDQLSAEHQNLLIVNVAGFGPFRHFLCQRFFVREDRLGCGVLRRFQRFCHVVLVRKLRGSQLLVSIRQRGEAGLFHGGAAFL